nr:hypothetical protein - human [Homo sapiens]
MSQLGLYLPQQWGLHSPWAT